MKKYTYTEDEQNLADLRAKYDKMKGGMESPDSSNTKTPSTTKSYTYTEDESNLSELRKKYNRMKGIEQESQIKEPSKQEQPKIDI